MADDLYKISLKKAMAICAGRETCLHDVKKKLAVWGVENEDSQKILSLLLNEKFIDEKRYSLAFVKDKFRYNRWGKIKLASALRMKNIPDELISEALDSIDENVYKGELKKIIENHKKTIKSKNKYDLNGKLLRYGLSKGFESYLLYELLNKEE